jgi:hypothetical protein
MADLLKPTLDVPSEPVVHFNNVQVQRELVPAWTEAQQYLGKSPQAVNALYNLQHSDQTTTVAAVSDGDDKYVPRNRTIQWDPKVGMLTQDGKVQTPANGLLHEEGHACEHNNNPARFAKQEGMANQRFDNGDEQRNMAWETKFSKELGEPTRGDHGGRAVFTKGPASAEIADKMIEDPAVIKSALHEGRFQLQSHGSTPPPPPRDDAAAIVKWDGKAHSGPVLHLNGDTAAQYVADPKGGPGQYQLYDVQKDLHGVIPPENNPRTTIDQQGHVAGRTLSPPNQALALADR